VKFCKTHATLRYRHKTVEHQNYSPENSNGNMMAGQFVGHQI
jgi:hypothetical protein